MYLHLQFKLVKLHWDWDLLYQDHLAKGTTTHHTIFKYKRQTTKHNKIIEINVYDQLFN